MIITELTTNYIQIPNLFCRQAFLLYSLGRCPFSPRTKKRRVWFNTRFEGLWLMRARFLPGKNLLPNVLFLGKIGIFFNFRLRPVHGSYVCLVDCIPFYWKIETGKDNLAHQRVNTAWWQRKTSTYMAMASFIHVHHFTIFRVHRKTINTCL